MTRTVGGAVTDALVAALHRDTDVPVDVGLLVAALPDDDFNLSLVAAAALQRLQAPLADDPSGTGEEARSPRATLHNDLSVKLVRVGDRAGALAPSR